MPAAGRDHRLIDALEARAPIAAPRTVWRACREDRDPTVCGRARGRWDDGTIDALYTAGDPYGAIAEVQFHVRRGQPVFPTKVRFELYELTVQFERLLDLSTESILADLGVDMARFGRLSYSDHPTEYLCTQDIAEAAHFLEFDGLLVPSARWRCVNTVVFCEALRANAIRAPVPRGRIDWRDWMERNATMPP